MSTPTTSFIRAAKQSTSRPDGPQPESSDTSVSIATGRCSPVSMSRAVACPASSRISGDVGARAVGLLHLALEAAPARSRSAAIPARRSSSTSAQCALALPVGRHDEHLHGRRAPVLVERQQNPLDPACPSGRRGRRPAEQLDQPVVAAAAGHLRLRAQAARTRTRTRCGCSSRGHAPACRRARSGPRHGRAGPAPPRSARRPRRRGARASSARAPSRRGCPRPWSRRRAAGSRRSARGRPRRARPRARAGRSAARRGTRRVPRASRGCRAAGSGRARRGSCSRSLSSTISSASTSGESRADRPRRRAG